MTSLVVDLRPGDCLRVGQARIAYQHKSGQVARIRVDAPADVPVQRQASVPKKMTGEFRANHAEIGRREL